MIEFKAECGHTVRAKDEDAGKAVRCSYCGRQTQVPDKAEGDDLDFLFSEVEKTGVYEAQSDRQRRRRMRKGLKVEGPRRGKERAVDAFSIVLKLCYAAVIIFVMMFVGKKVYEHVQAPQQTPRQVARRQAGGGSAPPVEQRPGSSKAMGLLHPRLAPNRSGVFVTSVPAAGDVYVVEAGTVQGSILRNPGGTSRRARSGRPIECEPGRYAVYVAVPVTDTKLMRLPGYQDLRRRIEDGGDGDLLEQYFVPDGSVEIVTDYLPHRPLMIVRKYECVVLDKTWSPVTALFLPELELPDLIKCLPPEARYGFDEEVVRTELRYQGIAAKDQRFIVDILQRVGMVSYRPDDGGSCRIFAINITDGSIFTRRVEARSRGVGWGGDGE